MLLVNASGYLTELAALNAYYPSVRLRAIGLLEKNSSSVLQRILEKESMSEFGQAETLRLAHFGD